MTPLTGFNTFFLFFFVLEFSCVLLVESIINIKHKKTSVTEKKNIYIYWNCVRKENKTESWNKKAKKCARSLYMRFHSTEELDFNFKWMMIQIFLLFSWSVIKIFTIQVKIINQYYLLLCLHGLFFLFFFNDALKNLDSG